MNINQLYQLIDDFKKLPPHVVRNPTFMEIAGYPHYENVCSNILKFYLQPNAPHDLGDLCLRSLLALVDCEDEQSNVLVQREEVTNAGNRIDILITSDTHLIAIENKIYHSVNNPFEDYSHFLEQRGRDKKIIKFLLTLYPVMDNNLHGFIPIQYLSFFSKIRNLIGEYTFSVNSKFSLLLTDFIETIENLQKGTAMDQNVINFFHDKSSDIEKLLEEVNIFKSELRTKVKELGNMMAIDNTTVPIKQRYYSENGKLWDDLIHDIKFPNNLTIEIDCFISTEGWRIAIRVVGSKDRRNNEKFKLLLNVLEIPFKENDKQWLDYPKIYPYNEPLPTLQEIIQDLIYKFTSDPNKVTNYLA